MKSYRNGRLIAVAVLLLALATPALARLPLDIGQKGPAFSLKGVDDKEHALGDYAEAAVVVVVFTCNHCPVAKAYQDRIIQIQKDYKDKGVQILAVNSNSPSVVPGDGLEHMKARAEEKGYNFPYLVDETQDVATAYGATVTPHVFLLDKERVLRYRGRVDDSQDPAGVKSHDLRNAIDAVLAGKDVPEPSTEQFGCSIKWAK